MSQTAYRHRPLSVEDYLQLEETSSQRHEYVGGNLYALAGATKRHNQIAGNIFAGLRNAARGGPCRVYISDVKLRAAPEAYYYPDVMVACGPEGSDRLIEEAPCLVVEVTSPSTEMIDQREKLIVYKRIASLRAYVIVHQERRRVERHWLDEAGTWWQDNAVASGRITFPCPETELTLDEIYQGTDVPA